MSVRTENSFLCISNNFYSGNFCSQSSNKVVITEIYGTTNFLGMYTCNFGSSQENLREQFGHTTAVLRQREGK